MQNLLNGIDDPALVMRVDDALTIEGWNGPLEIGRASCRERVFNWV